MYLLLLSVTNSADKSESAQFLATYYLQRRPWPAQKLARVCWVKYPQSFIAEQNVTFIERECAVLASFGDEAEFNQSAAADKLRSWYNGDPQILKEFNKNPFAFIRNGNPGFGHGTLRIFEASLFENQPQFKAYFQK